MFTSGTTGNPKGVVMTHGQTLRAYLDWCDWADLRAGDRYLIVNPFFHIFGYKAGCLASLMRGATIFPVAVFDAGVVLELVERERITVLPGPPTIYQSLLDHPDRDRRDISSLRLARHRRRRHPGASSSGGSAKSSRSSASSPGTGSPRRARSPAAGPTTTSSTSRRPSASRGPGFEVRTVDRSGRRRAAPGEPGEVVVRGETVMRGYLDDPEATAAAIDADGWLHTGDLGTFDADGYLRIVGRIKDMFIVGGFNAYPAEIENLLLRHPRIAQVAVIGVPDERLGEVGMAFVVLEPGPPVEPAEIIEWARAEMANFKVPRVVEFLDALPGERDRQGRQGRAAGRDVREPRRDGARDDAGPGRGGHLHLAERRPAADREPLHRVRDRHVPGAGLVPALRVDRDGRAPARPARAGCGRGRRRTSRRRRRRTRARRARTSCPSASATSSCPAR